MPLAVPVRTAVLCALFAASPLLPDGGDATVPKLQFHSSERLAPLVERLEKGVDRGALAATAELSDDELRAITIPHGVAHGFLFHEPSIHLYAVSRYWDTADELACFWGDAGLAI